MTKKSKGGVSLTWYRFLHADALWTMTMAINVYLTFFRKYNQRDLRHLELKYGILCYSTPFVLPFHQSTWPRKNLRVCCGQYFCRCPYSFAEMTWMWCWISLKWDFLRVAVFYAPVWVVIFITFSPHIRIDLRILQEGLRTAQAA